MGVFATNLLRNLLQFFPSFDCTPRKWDKLLSHSAAMLFSIGEEFRSAACKVLKVKIASYKYTLSFTPVDIGSVVETRISINKPLSIWFRVNWNLQHLLVSKSELRGTSFVWKLTRDNPHTRYLGIISKSDLDEIEESSFDEKNKPIDHYICGIHLKSTKLFFSTSILLTINWPNCWGWEHLKELISR